MSFDSGTDSELVPEFIATVERFRVAAKTQELRKLVSRMTEISQENSIHEGTDLIQIRSVSSADGSTSFLELSTTNGSLYMNSMFFQAKALTDEVLHIPAKKFSEILKMASGDNVLLRCSGFTLSISSGNALWKLQLPPKAKFPKKPESETNATSISTKDLSRGMREVIKASASGMARASLMQLKFGDGYVLACDGGRLHRSAVEAMKGSSEFTLPIEGAKVFLKALTSNNQEDEIVLKHSASSVSLILDTETITVKRGLTPYPEVEKVFISQSIMSDTSAVMSRLKLKEAVNSVKLFADDVLSSVSLTVVSDAKGRHKMIVQSEDIIGNSSNVAIDTSYSGKNQVKLKLNYKNVQDVLDSVTSDLISIKVGKNSKTSKTSAFIEDLDTGFVAVLSQTNKE